MKTKAFQKSRHDVFSSSSQHQESFSSSQMFFSSSQRQKSSSSSQMSSSSSQRQMSSSSSHNQIFSSLTQKQQTNIDKSDDDESDTNEIIKDDLTTNVCCQY